MSSLISKLCDHPVIRISALALGLTANVSAATLTWDGGYEGASGPTWNNAANWGGVAYADHSDLIFQGKNGLDTYLAANRAVKSITFAANAGVFAIELRTSGYIPSAANLTFNSTNTGIATAPGNVNAQTINGLGSVVLEANLTATLDGAGPLYILRPVTGPFGITKTGTGSMYLYGGNTYSGLTTVSEGKLVISTQSKGGGAFTVSGGAILGVDRETPHLNNPVVTRNLKVSTLTLGASTGATMTFVLRDGNSTVPAVTAESLVLNGTNRIAIEGGAFALGQFPLLQYTAKTGSGTIATAPLSLPAGVAGSIVNNTANKSYDLLITALPNTYGRTQPGAVATMRVDTGRDYYNDPDAFPVCKAGNGMIMIDGPASQHVFNTTQAILELPYNGTDAYPGNRVTTANNAMRDKEAQGWNVPAVFVYREDWAIDTVTNPGGAYPEDWRILSSAEIADVRNEIATSTLVSKDVKVIQLLGGHNPASAVTWFTFAPALREHLLLFDGIGIEVHVGDSDNANENVSRERLTYLLSMASMAKWATDNGKVGFTFMGGDKSTYSDLIRAQHTYVSLWREMLRLGVDYRAPNLIYLRQGAHKNVATGDLDGVHVPESATNSLTYQQKWVMEALKGTSLFITDSGSKTMTAGTTAKIPFIGGKVETDPLSYTATSSNQTLVSNASLQISGEGFNHTLAVTPNAGQTGTTTITLRVTDGIDTRTNAFVLTVTAAATVPAAASGSINVAATWGGAVPVAGDTQVWQTGNKAISMTANATDSFEGGTLELQAGGILNPGTAGAVLNLNKLTLSGGLISISHNLGFSLNLRGKQMTLNSGTLRSGLSGRNVVVENAVLAGSGTIQITGLDTSGSHVEFVALESQGFTGVFSVSNNGVLNLPHIINDKVSFGVQVSGTGKYANDAAVSLTSLVLGTDTIAPGVYQYEDFTTYQKGFLLNRGGTIIVSSGFNEPPTISPITDQTVNESTPTGAIPFTVQDDITAANSLVITASTNNPSFVPAANIVLAGSGANRTVTVTPSPEQSGAATIALTVSDGAITSTRAFQVTVNRAADLVLALAGGGPINDESTWDRALPTAGDARIWRTGANPIRMTTAAETFNGGTFVIQSGGLFAPGVPTAVLTLNHVMLNGGTITMDRGAGLIIDLSGDVLTLNSGILKAGGGGDGRDVKFRNGSLAGSGVIQITGTDTTGSDVEFQSTVVTKGFTGAFDVKDNGILNLSAITANNASFGVILSGSGKYAHDANVALTSLVIDGTAIPSGIYTYSSFTQAQQAFFVGTNVNLSITINHPPTISPLATQTIAVNSVGSPINFTVGDTETAAAALTLTKGTNNATLIPGGGIVLGGSGANRTVTLTPAANKLGASTITLNLSDGIATTSTSFIVNVTGTVAETWRFANFGTTANTGSAADLADSNKDGENNLLEFATGQNPNASGRTATPVGLNGPNIEFIYIRSLAALSSGVIYAVEYSDSLSGGSWSGVGVTEQILADNGTVQTVKAICPAGAGGKRFARLSVALP
jgi:autotransporter-associated beta strand protein